MADRHIAALGLAMLFAMGKAHATTYNAVTDFSLASNPNGPWSYQATGSLLGFTTPTCGGTSSCQGWSNNQSLPNTASVDRNVSSSAITVSNTVVIQTNYLNLDPQANANVGLVFTAPTSGAYTVVGSFLGDDVFERGHSVEVLDNQAAVYTNVIASFQQNDTFSFSRTLNAGETLSFLSLTGDSFTNLGTGLQAEVTDITPIPEPASVALAAVGFIGVAGMSRRQRRA